MSKPEFVYVTYIATTPERLWHALTRGEFTKRYWFNRRIDSDWQPGSPLRFYDGDGDTVTDEGQVLASDPPRLLSYTFSPVGYPPSGTLEGGHTRVTFTIEPFEGVVKLTLVHDELASDEVAAGYREGWAPILSSLKTFLETGRPLPERRAGEHQARQATERS